jgi:LuxR family quorum-sensing system transcriptional regulator CciR
MRISDFIDESNKLDSPEVLLTLMERAVADLGFDRYAYCALTRHERYKLSDSPAPAVALNYPTSWTDYYFEHDYQDKDPVLLHASEFEGPFLWDSLDAAYALEPDQNAVMQEAREAGLLDGVGIPLHGARGNFCLLTCAAGERHPEPTSAFSSLGVLAAQFHAVYSALCRSEPDRRSVPVLSERERACLQWIARGKTSWDVGEILNISENTVNFHIKKAFAKLNANNRIAAVVNAIRYGLISL